MNVNSFARYIDGPISTTGEQAPSAHDYTTTKSVARTQARRSQTNVSDSSLTAPYLLKELVLLVLVGVQLPSREQVRLTGLDERFGQLHLSISSPARDVTQARNGDKFRSHSCRINLGSRVTAHQRKQGMHSNLEFTEPSSARSVEIGSRITMTSSVNCRLPTRSSAK